MKMKTAPVTALMLSMIAGQAMAQQTIRVPSDVPNLTLALNPGASGLMPGDTIVLEAGSSNAGTFQVLTPDITIRGEGASPVVVNAFNTGAVFTVDIGAGRLTMENLRVINGNSASNGGAVNILNSGGITLTDCEFEDNTADAGGAIYTLSNSAVIEITGCVFTGCTANLFGGALRTGGSNISVTIEGTTISDCHALGGAGGGIDHSSAGSTLIVRDSVFSGNSTTTMGGAAWINGAATTLFENVDILDNLAVESASDDAGGVFVTALNGPYVFRDCDFERNICNGSGAALRFTTATGDVINCRFVDNEASSGGAMQVVGGQSDVRVYGSVFDGNSARREGAEDHSGGAILTNSSSTIEAMLTVFNSLFINNTAANGGAINASDQSFVFVESCTFWNNVSDNLGGAVWRSNPNSDVLIDNSIFHQNLPADKQVSINGSGFHQANSSHFDLPYTATGAGNLDGDPMLVDPSGGDFSLMAGSPAIDAGDSTRYGGPGSPDSLSTSDPARYVGPGSDLALNPRMQDDPDTADSGGAFVGAVIDMGAFEFTVPTGPACAADVNGDGLATPADFTAWLSAFNIGCP